MRFLFNKCAIKEQAFLQKPVSSIADRIYRNIRDGKSSDPYLLKDWLRSKAIISEANVYNVPNVLDQFKPYTQKIDLKKTNINYRGVHLNLIINGTPFKMQLHPKQSWEVKLQQDKIYAKWRNV